MHLYTLYGNSHTYYNYTTITYTYLDMQQSRLTYKKNQRYVNDIVEAHCCAVDN